MTDDTMQTLADLRSEVPFPDGDAMRSAYERIVRPPRRRLVRPRRLGLVVVAAVLVFAAASVAAVKEGPWWQSGEPAVDPQQVVSVARDNLPAHVDVTRARTVATDGNAALVAVPLNTNGYCLIPALDGHATLGAQCEYQVTSPERGVDDRTVSVIRQPRGERAAAWIVYGRITDPRAAKLDLGAFTLALADGGFFLARVPASQWTRLSGTASNGAILDGSGAVLRRGCVNWAIAPTGGADDGEYDFPLLSESQGGDCKPLERPIEPTTYFANAITLFDLRLTQNFSIWKAGQTITFKMAPRSDGTDCLVITGPGTMEPSSRCATVGQASPSQPIGVGIGATLTHVDGKPRYTWEVSGSVDPDRKIEKLELRSGTSTTPVTLGGGFFFGQFPVTTPGPSVGTLPMPPGAWKLVGLDGAGNEVASVDLVALHERSTPHP